MKLSRNYRLDRELRNLARWIKEAVENLLRRNPKGSMDRDSVKISRDKKKERPDRKESVEDLSRAVELEENVFFNEEKHIKMNATSKQLK